MPITEKKRVFIALAALCVLGFGIMFSLAIRDGAIVDEIAHIPAGYAYITRLDYRLNPEHPPLPKALAAIPLVFLHLNFPATNSFWTTAVNGEWGVGGAFIYGVNDHNAATILLYSRIFPIFLTIGLILLTYGFASEAMGKTWALLPAALLALSPTILAQGHYATTDIAAAFGAMLSLWIFVRFLRAPSARGLFFAGLAFGAAQLMKFSDLILLPVIAVILIFHFISVAARSRSVRCANDRDEAENPGTDNANAGGGANDANGRAANIKIFLKYVWYFIAISLVGFFIVIYPVYALFTAGYPPARQLSDTVSILGNLPAATCSPLHPVNCLAKVDIAAAQNTITRPAAQYFLGIIMAVQRLTGNDMSYFMGHVYNNGTPWYFPVVYLLKEALPTLAILIIGAIFAIARIVKAILEKATRFTGFVIDGLPQFSLLVFAIAYWAVSIRSPLDIGLRHLFPAIAPMYILAASSLRRREWHGLKFGTHKTPIVAIFAVVMIGWLGLETAFAYPYLTSYYNEIGGGVWNGYVYAADSNYDWGQDMPALAEWMNQHPEINRIALDFFGGSNPAYYLGDKYVAWNSAMGDPADQGIQWFAISIDNLENAIQPAAASFQRAPDEDYSWLVDSRPKASGMGAVPAPDYRVGTTIFIYKL